MPHESYSTRSSALLATVLPALAQGLRNRRRGCSGQSKLEPIANYPLLSRPETNGPRYFVTRYVVLQPVTLQH